MNLDVLVPTFRRPRICAAVCGVVVQELGPGDGLCVVDQSPPDEHAWLRARLAGLPRTTLVRLATPGLPGARNEALGRTRRPGVVFLDDDAVPLPGWLEAHRRALVAGHTMVAGRIVEARVEPNSQRLDNRLDRAGRVRTRLDSEQLGQVQSPKGANMSFRRTALERVGGFDPRYGGTAFLEEADVAAAIGAPVHFAPEAAVVHLSAPSGGVRPQGEDQVLEALRWRFHNTALYLRRHRGLPWQAPVVFGLLALRTALARRSLQVLSTLGEAAQAGWHAGGASPKRETP